MEETSIESLVAELAADPDQSRAITISVGALLSLVRDAAEQGRQQGAPSPRETPVTIKEIGRDADGNMERVVEWRSTAVVVPLADSG